MSGLLPFLTAIIFGVCSALIALAGIYVRFDLGAVFAYLRARRVAKNLSLQEGHSAAWQAAQTEATRLADAAAFPDDLAKLWPLALLVGALAFALVLRVFNQKSTEKIRPDIKERMILRLAHRKGGAFSVDDLHEAPLLAAEALEAADRLCENGILQKVQGGYVLAESVTARP